MRVKWRVILAVVLCAATAWAEPDTFGLGTGREGALSVTESRTVINRYTQVTGPLATGDTSVFVSSAQGLAAGDLIMVLQTTGVVPEPRRGDPSPINLTADPVGRWELARVEAVMGGELRLTAPLTHSYAGLVSQVIRVPEYTDVTVDAGASLVAEPWNGSTGGVLAFLATGTLRNEGKLNVMGAGFRAGVAPHGPVDVLGCATLPGFMREGAVRGEGIAVLGYGPLERGMDNASNGGGGGGCPLAGGGGGGNGAAGGRGGDALVPWDVARELGGQGGSALEYSLVDHLSLGGGGGQGHGETGNSRAGAGGGGIFVRAQRLKGKGSIVADGEDGQPAVLGGAGGGGAGGSIYLRFVEGAECGSVSSRGGKGGVSSARALAYSGPGGGGGGGRVLLHAEGIESCPISVEAGLAGEGTSALGAEGIGASAEPTANHLAAHRGVIKLLLGSTATLACDKDMLPIPEIDSPKANDAISDTTPDIWVSLSDTGGYEMDIFIDRVKQGSAVETPAGSKKWLYTPTNPLVPGSHTIVAKVDCSGNGPKQPAESASISIWIDFEPPQTTITGKPLNPSNTNSATFNFDAQNEQREAFFKCQLDNEPVADCSTPRRHDSTVSYGNLPEGSHTFRVQATDAAKNVEVSAQIYSWVVDTLVPDTTIVEGSKPASVTSATTASFTYTSTEAGVDFFCRLNNDAVASCDTTGRTYPNLADGQYTFCVYAQDKAGNKDDQSPACHPWRVDTVKPDTTIQVKPKDPINQTVALFEFSANEAGVAFWCALDSSVFEPCTSPKTYPVGAGTHTFRVYAKDAAGNQEDTVSAASHSWTVDLVKPETSIKRSPPSLTKNPNAEFEFGSNELVVSYWCSLDNAIYAPCNSPQTFPSLPDGAHRLCVVARDAADNEDSTPECHPWTVDTTKPSTIIERGPRNPTNELTARFEFKASEAGVTFFCSLDNQTFAACVSPVEYSVTQGPHNFRVYAKDAADNVEDFAGTTGYNWTVDLTPPNVPVLVTPSEGLASNATTSLIVDGTAEALSTVSVFLNGSPSLAGTAVADNLGRWGLTISISGLAEGEHTLTANAKDVAGNTGLLSNVRKFILDRVPPVTSISGKPLVLSNSRLARFSFQSNEPVRGYRCNLLDGRGWFDCPNSLELPNLPDGTHTLDVVAVDFAGNEDGTAERYQWTVDTVAPDVRVTQPANSEEIGLNTPVIAGDAERAAVVRVFIDGSNSPIGDVVAAPDGKWELRIAVPLSLGSHTLSVEATDSAGNKGSFGPISFLIDTEAPDTEIVNKPAAEHNRQESSFVFRSTNGAKFFECSLDPPQLDDPPFVVCEPVYTVELNDGPHRLLVRAVDNAGNKDPTPARHDWRVSVKPPPTPEITEPQDGADVYSLTPTISGTTVPGGEVSLFIDDTRLSGSAFADEQGRWAYTLSAPLAEGPHTLEGMVKNEIGNRSGKSAPRTFIAKPARAQAKATGGGLGCDASGLQPGLALLGLVAGAVWNSRRRRR